MKNKFVLYVAAPLTILAVLYPLLIRERQNTVKSYGVHMLQAVPADSNTGRELGEFRIDENTVITRTAIRDVDGFDFNIKIDLLKGNLAVARASITGSGYWSPNVEDGMFMRKIKLDNPHDLLRGANCYAVKTPQGMFFVIRYQAEASNHLDTADIVFPLSADYDILDPIRQPNLEALQHTALPAYKESAGSK